MQNEIPKIITKAWVSFLLKRPFRWIREKVLTDEVLTEELEYDLAEFKNWRSFPPVEGNRLKKWLKEKELL